MSELPWQAFLAPKLKFRNTKWFILFTFCQLVWFLKLKIPFRGYLTLSPLGKLAWFPCLSWLVNFTQDTRIFPASWILIGQFKFPARQPYARCSLINRVLKNGHDYFFLKTCDSRKSNWKVCQLPGQRPSEVRIKENFAKGLRVCSLWWRCQFLLISIAFGEDRCLRFFFRGEGLEERTKTRPYFRALFVHCDAAPWKVS